VKRPQQPGASKRSRPGCLGRLLGSRGPSRVERFAVAVPESTRAGEALDARVAPVDAAGNPAERFEAVVQVICLTDNQHAQHLGERTIAGPDTAIEGLRVEGAGTARLLVVDPDSGLAGVSAPLHVTDAADRGHAGAS